MAFRSANMAGERSCVFYLLLIAVIGGEVGLAFNIWTPYIGGSFANHHPPHSSPYVVRPYPSTPFVGNPHHHTTTFMGGNGHPFLSSSSGGTAPFVRTPTAVRNNISLLLPSGNVIPWWPSHGGGGGGLSSSDSITVGGVKIQIDRTANKRPSATGTSKPCRTCGKTSSSSTRDTFLNPNNIHGLGSFLPPRRSTSHVVVWPESTSQYRPFNVVTIERGRPNSLDYHLYFRNEDGPVSPFHDIPLFANEGNKIFNMVVEVPRWTNAKMEISTKDPLNPIKQDVKKGKLRFVANCFPHHGYIWNYGALPQTWEDPNHTDEATGCKGDNDPIDVCEIGYRVAKRGEVIQVKVLGTLALIDEGETDWKLIAIDVNDPMAPQLSDIADVEKHMPGFLKATVEWFRIYKIPDGKPENQFAFSGDAKDRDFAHKIIMETHEAWQHLVEGKTDTGGLSNTCVCISKAANKLSQAEAEEVINTSPECGPGLPMDSKVDLWHYVSLK